jgi:hypothetical protein
VAGSVAFAGIPDSSGVIHACYHKSNSQLRIIDSSVDSCRANETELTWNQTGPQGPQGPQGGRRASRATRVQLDPRAPRDHRA